MEMPLVDTEKDMLRESSGGAPGEIYRRKLKSKREARPGVTLLRPTEPQKIRPAPGASTQRERKVQPAPPPSCPRSTTSAGKEKRRNPEEPRQRQSRRWEKPRRGITQKREGYGKLGETGSGRTSHFRAAVIMGALGNAGQ